MKKRRKILNRVGFDLPKDAHILDFGCGAGRTVYSLLDQGYSNSVGYDVKDYLELRDPNDRLHFFIAEYDSCNRLPFEDNSFDLIISEEVFEHLMDQVTVLRELHRIMRPGSHALHVFPARYCPIEPHIFVPFGGLIGHRWWYKLWALGGIRNEYQKHLSANQTADRNAYYFVKGLNYVPNSCYEVVWQHLGYEYKWVDQESFDASERKFVRMLGRLNRVLPLVSWMSRTFHTRWVYLKKKTQ